MSTVPSQHIRTCCLKHEVVITGSSLSLQYDFTNVFYFDLLNNTVRLWWCYFTGRKTLLCSGKLSDWLKGAHLVKFNSSSNCRNCDFFFIMSYFLQYLCNLKILLETRLVKSSPRVGGWFESELESPFNFQTILCCLICPVWQLTVEVPHG